MIISPSLPNRIDEAHPRQTLELPCPSCLNSPKDKSDGGPIVLSTCKEVLQFLEMEELMHWIPRLEHRSRRNKV